MPLAGHVGMVARVSQEFRQRRHAFVEIVLITYLSLDARQHIAAEHRAQAGGVVIRAGQEHRTSRGAGRRDVKVRQLDTSLRQTVQVRCIDLSAEGADIDALKVKTVFVDEGPSMKRIKPRAKGRADRIVKRTSHITVIVADN